MRRIAPCESVVSRTTIRPSVVPLLGSTSISGISRNGVLAGSSQSRETGAGMGMGTGAGTSASASGVTPSAAHTISAGLQARNPLTTASG